MLKMDTKTLDAHYPIFEQRLMCLKDAGFDAEAEAAGVLQDALLTARAIANSVYGDDWKPYVLPIYEVLARDTSLMADNLDLTALLAAKDDIKAKRCRRTI